MPPNPIGAAQPEAAGSSPIPSDDPALPSVEPEVPPQADRYFGGDPRLAVWSKFKIADGARVLPEFTFRQEIQIRDAPHHFVDIGHVAVSSGLMLYTNGLWPCVAVAVLNRATQRALLMHASSADEVSQLSQALNGLGKGPLEAYIAGGENAPFSRRTLEAILNVLEVKKIPLAGFRPNQGVDSLAIDPMTGRVY